MKIVPYSSILYLESSSRNHFQRLRFHLQRDLSYDKKYKKCLENKIKGWDLQGSLSHDIITIINSVHAL